MLWGCAQHLAMVVCRGARDKLKWRQATVAPPASGEDQHVEKCNGKSCTADRDCVRSRWSPWSDCSCSCAGVQRRIVASLCMVEATANGFRSCVQAWPTKSENDAIATYESTYGRQTGSWPTKMRLRKHFATRNSANRMLRRMSCRAKLTSSQQRLTRTLPSPPR